MCVTLVMILFPSYLIDIPSDQCNDLQWLQWWAIMSEILNYQSQYFVKKNQLNDFDLYLLFLNNNFYSGI